MNQIGDLSRDVAPTERHDGLGLARTDDHVLIDEPLRAGLGVDGQLVEPAGVGPHMQVDPPIDVALRLELAEAGDHLARASLPIHDAHA